MNSRNKASICVVGMLIAGVLSFLCLEIWNLKFLGGSLLITIMLLFLLQVIFEIQARSGDKK